MITSAIEAFKSLVSSKSKTDEDFEHVPSLPRFPCPVCDKPMLLLDVQPIEQFGLKDVRLHALKCEACGMVADRVFHPSIGYDHTFVL